MCFIPSRSRAWERAQGAHSARSKPAHSTGRSRNDTSIKALTAFVLLGALGSLPSSPAAADDGRFLQGGMSPNVMIIVDISGRGDNTPATAYMPTKRYPVQSRCRSSSRPGKRAKEPCAASAIFKDSVYSRYADSVSRVSGSGATEARRALAESGHWSGALKGVRVTLYAGNYINYLAGRCTGGAACPETKMTTVRRVISSVVENVSGIRFGVMTFDDGSHGVRGTRVVAPVGSGSATLKSALSTLGPARDAPLGDALYDAGQYFKGEPLTSGTTFPSPIELGCQANHVIVITDGTQTSEARAMTAEAALRRQQDHSSTHADVQRVIVHTIGYGVTIDTPLSTSARTLTDLKQVADSGGGVYAQAGSATELEASLRRILARVTQATYTFTNPVVPVITTADSRRLYLASFQRVSSTRLWRGSLKAYQRDANGVIPVDADGLPISSALIWDAGRALNSRPSESRTIYTEVGGKLTPFTKANHAITSTMLGVSRQAERDRIIDAVRGGDIDVGDRPGGAGGTRDDGAWKLGAILHSTPVLVSAPPLALRDSGYRAFKSSQVKRTSVLLVGASDGMLHAFREKDGAELWAFIPPDMLDRLHPAAAVERRHAAVVDGSPVAADVKVGDRWKTIVIFGCRRGGPHYYALDVTDTTDPKFLWRFTDPRIRETWSEPAIGKVKVRGSDRHVAFVGGGASPAGDNAYGKALFAIDLASGAKLWEYDSTTGQTDDRQYMNFSIAARPTAIDSDNDGYVDHVYVGDVGGQIWKFDVAAGDTSGWKGKRFFAPSAPPAIDDAPTREIPGLPAFAMDHQRNLWVFFGTGDRTRPHSTSTGRFYGLKDTTGMANGAALTDASPGITDATTGNAMVSQGWYVVLGEQGEKTFGTGIVFNGVLFFSTFTPDRAGACGAEGGTTRLYALQAFTGYAAMDFNAPAPAAALPRFKALGRGSGSTPVVVLTPPIAAGAPATASVIIVTSNQQLFTTAIPAPPFLKHITSWRDRGP